MRWWPPFATRISAMATGGEGAYKRLMHSALDTLLLAFAGEGRIAVPEQALFLGAHAHPMLKEWPAVTGWQPLKPLADEWDKTGRPRMDDPGREKWPVVLVLPGKSRDETFFWFALARDRLLPGGRMIVAMPNTAGAARFEKELARATGQVTSLQKHKCRAFHAMDNGNWNEALFTEWRALGQHRTIPGTDFVTAAGVFSSEHIDPGSQLLAKHLPANLRGRAADLGAGWGFLTDALLRRCPAITSTDLFEADSRALDCARRNLAVHPRDLRFHWHDVTAGIPDTFDVIVMNPPFHTGQESDVGLGRAFLTTAASAMRRGGKLLIVANRQLPYEAVLDSLRLAWRNVAGDTTYKVILAEKR
jgi:16S rRNA (guanine1207-N2)-methyltransferase